MADTPISIRIDENDKEITGVELSQKWAEAIIEINEGKIVPIKINTTGTLPSGLRLKSISSTTTEIGITGPESALSSINEIGTETINLSEIKLALILVILFFSRNIFAIFIDFYSDASYNKRRR